MQHPGDDAALVAIAAELCALPLARFTAERNARAKAARADGDRALADGITALPKPSVAAWVVDLLAREDPDDLQRVLRLGADLRAAQEARDRDRLRELTTERRTLLAEVARGAADRAEATGQRVGDGVLEEVQQTLQAALADPAAAGAIASGRLVRALDADGLDPADLDDTVAAGAPEADATRGSRRPSRQCEQRRREAERRVAEAKHLADDAASRARAADADVEERTRDVEDLRRRVQELQARLDSAQEALEQAGAAADAARQRADDAAAELDRLTSGD